MATTKEDIRGWRKRGEELGATHLIVVCDTFDWDDYPVFVMKNECPRKKIKEYNGVNMQKIMEIILLDK